MLQILLTIVWLLLVPFGCGLWITAKLPKERQSMGMILLNGYLIMIAFFQCFYLGFLVAGSISFKLLTWLFGIVIVLYTVASTVFGWKTIKECLPKMKMKEAVALKSVFVAFVILQVVMRLRQQIFDGDDAFYIATAANSYTSGTMNYIQPYTGMITQTLDMRHAFAAAPTWLAFLSKATMIHPAIMGHCVLAPMLIVLHYLVILQVGEVLFKKKKNQKYLFASLVALFNMYGYVSIYTAQTFFLTRTWQGKSIFANLFFPILLLILLWLGDKAKEIKNENMQYILAGIIMFAGSSMTTMAVVLLPMVFMLGILFLAIYRKEPWMLLKGVVACVPVGIVGLLYMLM